MKRFISILSIGAALLAMVSCVKDEVRTVFDPSRSTAPSIQSYTEQDGDVTITFTPGTMNVNQKIANHWVAITSLEDRPVSKSLTSSLSDNTLKVTAANLSKALIELGSADGSMVNFELVVRSSPLSKSECRDDEPNTFLDSKEVVKITDYLVIVPSGDPYARYNQESPWGLVGSFNNWGNDGVADHPMFTDGKLHVAKLVELNKGDEVKFRKDSDWAVNFGYAEGVDSYTLDEEFALSQGGPNIVIAESGTYYFILDPDGATAKIVVAVPADDSLPDIDLSGYEYNDAMAGAETWGIIGPAVSDWSTDVDMEKVSEDPEIWVAKDIPFQEDKFKFRGNDEWADYDLGGAPEFALDTPLQLSKGGGDMTSQAGVYNVYLYPTYMLVYITEGSGDTPPPPEKPKAWSLIGHIADTNWDTDFDLENVSGNKWVIKNVTVKADDEFKLRADHDWAKNVGGPEGNDVSTLDPDDAYEVYKPEIGVEFVAGDKNIRIGVEGVYNVTLNYGDESTILIEEYKEFPDDLYMTGTDFGGWDWSKDGVVKLIPVINKPDWGVEAEGQFWTVRYFKAGNGVKFNSHRDWDGGQFGSLETNEGFTNDTDGNVQVPEDGFYMVHIDLKRSILHVEPARIYGIGACFGGWDEEMESALFTADGETLKITVPNEGELRMYAASKIATSEWWTREFIFFEDGVIDYRGDNEDPGDQARRTVLKDQTVILDFNAGTGTVTGEGQASELPETMYIIGTAVGGWDWDADYIVDMTPVNGKKGQFWAIRYLEAGSPFKFCAAKAWGKDFTGLGEDSGYTVSDNNCVVAESGVYMIYVDTDNKKLCIEPAKVYGMGNCFGGWDEGMADALFTEADGKLTGTVKADGELRLYAASSIATSAWWTREFIILDGKIAYRGNGDDQERVNVTAGSTVTLDFNAGTGTIESGGGQGGDSVKITIDGDMSDWADIEGATSDGVYKSLKATNDDEFFYIYSMRNKKRGNELWGTNKGYYYYDFDMDNNPDTGDYAEGSHGGFEAWMYLYLFGGTPEAPDFWESPKGDGKPSSSVIADVLCKGVVDDNPAEDGLIQTEVRIPRANLPAVEKGQTISITSWGNKDANLMKVTFTVK
ncbi:MAG: SusF/SusE family outer membrane protein [Bacteroidales bacterium]|nr:SusF/SusE family outer membrane protein [Bacteroidales bacterium]